MEEELYGKILSRLQSQCARREYCVNDIKAKVMKSFDGDTNLAERAVASLVADKFVDNMRYAAAFAREKSSLSGWGRQKIAFALRSKGIDRETIEAALDEIDGEAACRKMESVIAAKYRTLAEDPACRLKLLRFALSRGYSYDDVRGVVDRIMKNG